MDTKSVERSINTPAVHSLVRSYLLARTFYEVTKEKVDAVWLQLLKENPMYVDRKCSRRHVPSGERIYDHDKLYRSADEAGFQRLLDLADKRLRAAGIKPATMGRDYCPALVANDKLSKIQRALVDEAGKGMGITADRLLCHGLDDYYKFIDLVVGATVNNPKFKPPKI